MAASRVAKRGAAVGSAVLAGVALRRASLHWGATGDEWRGHWPGDDLVDGAEISSTMAVTVDAAPADVWPWLVQMGCDRAGWYSIDRLDNGGRPSADAIIPEYQHVEVGDRWAATPDGRLWFEVAEVVPERRLVLRVCVDGKQGRSYPSGTSRPRRFSDGLWAFHLRPTPDGRTRVVVRTGGTGRPRALTRLTNVAIWEPAHVVMQKAQFAHLRQRVGGSASTS